MVKILAWYLPQFYVTKENDEWWGEGFTDWVKVREGKKLYSDQLQPRRPLHDNYYDLCDINTIQWQISLAKKYGVYGFCLYHYWFDGKKLLDKPGELLLSHKELDIPFCLCWTNERWTTSWTDGLDKILMEQYYGDEKNWEEHFQYLLKFFLDPRYIYDDDCPLFGIYVPEDIECLNDMLAYWDKRARDYGLKGICYFYNGVNWNDNSKKDDSAFKYEVYLEPAYSMKEIRKNTHANVYLVKQLLPTSVKSFFSKEIEWIQKKILNNWNKNHASYNYDEVWKQAIKRKESGKKAVQIAGAFSDWDNTCRKGFRGTYLSGASPEAFKKYFKQIIEKAKDEYKSDYIFFFAWNEWAEGGYLEPDVDNEYGYLEAIHESLIETGELL